MTLASGANVAAKPVVRSENLVPTATSRSARDAAKFASGLPCIPIIPKKRRWLSGNAPLPMSVHDTGISPASAKAISSSVAPEAMTPPPASMSGRSARDRASLAP
jgi:hypothetical protein